MIPMWISIIATILIRLPLAWLLAFLTRSQAWPRGNPQALFASLTGPPGVRHTSFVRQPPDLPSRLYVYPLGFGLCCNLTRRLALYQVSVRRLLDFATPLPPLLASPPAACGSLRLAVNTRDRTFTG